MTLLQSAYRRILHYWPDFARIKRAKEADDIFKIIKFERELADGVSEVTQIKDNAHIHRMLKDSNITKVYYSDKILEEFKYLAFIQLGIQYLKEQAEFEGAHIGRRILEEKITEEKKKLWPVSSKDWPNR